MPRQKPRITVGPDVDLETEVVIVGVERLTDAEAEGWAADLENRDRSHDLAVSEIEDD